MLKILQDRLQKYVNREHPDVQAGFRKGKGTIDQIANIHWIIKKAKELSKEDLHNPDNHDGVITHLEPDIFAKSSGPLEASLWTKLVEVMEFQLSYFKS